VVDDSYLDRHQSIARDRIARAGVRLAGLLSRALSDEPLSAELLGLMLARPFVQLRPAPQRMARNHAPTLIGQ
jgi:hypothetical protein